MNHSTLCRVSLILLLILLGAAVSLAQSSSPSPSPSPEDTAQPPTAPAAKNTTPDKNQPKDKKKPKKVWTSDEMSSIGGTISVVGESAPSNSAKDSMESQTATGSSKSVDSARERQIANYRNQVVQLRSQLEAIERKITELRKFKGENSSSSGGIDIRHGYSMTPVGDQIAQLEDKKKQIQAKIDALEDDARKNSVEPGQLR
jgi:hypothetical protein